MASFVSSLSRTDLPKQQQVTALLALDWSYRRIEAETGVRRETVSRYDRRAKANAAKVFPGSDGADPPAPEWEGTADPANAAKVFPGSPPNAAKVFPGLGSGCEALADYAPCKRNSSNVYLCLVITQ
jgi:hypothetical protein